MSATLNRIPAELRKRPQWVVWRLEERDGKPTKAPYQPGVPNRRASVTNPKHWATYDVAAAVADVDGVGFVFTADDPYCGIDLDACINKRGELHPTAAEIVSGFDSYAERSCSGRGVHIIARGTLGESGNRTKQTPWGGDIEVYDRARFFVMTGEEL